MSKLVEAFAAIGVLMTAVLLVLLASVVHDVIKELVHRLKYRRAVKHRFDKPPMAKCYCVDCDRYNPKSGECYGHSGWYVADSWFCWSATPRKREPPEDKKED